MDIFRLTINKKNERRAKKNEKAAAIVDKDELYIMRKNTFLKVVRGILWLMLIFIFIKGVIVSVRMDPTVEVNKTITNFKKEFSGYKEQDNEVLAFANNFAVEYLTYKAGSEADYANRLRKYAADSIANIGYKFNSGTSSTVVYSQAYRKEEYSDTQTDVWVLLDVEYKSQETAPNGKITEKTTTEKTTLKVPVIMKDNHYIVEDLPAYVNDNIKTSNFTAAAYKGKECTTDITEAIREALNNFYKAYYEEDQSVINYFLAADADKNNFIGLNGRVTFDGIYTIRAYYAAEGTTTQFVVILTLNVIDKNGVRLPQNYNLEVVYKDKQYYVRTMNTRNTNLNIKEAIE
jgi:hypothetical protein